MTQSADRIRRGRYRVWRRTILGTALMSPECLFRLLTAEQGKPLGESHREFAGTAGWLRYYADLEVPPKVLRDDSEARGQRAVAGPYVNYLCSDHLAMVFPTPASAHVPREMRLQSSPFRI